MTRSERIKFSLRYALGVIGLVAILCAVLGELVRRDAAGRAERRREMEAYQRLEPTMSAQEAVPLRIWEQERDRLRPKVPEYPGGMHLGSSGGFRGWACKFKLISAGRVVADVTAEATIANGKLSPITIATEGGAEDERIVDLLVQEYTRYDWDYVVRQNRSDADAGRKNETKNRYETKNE